MSLFIRQKTNHIKSDMMSRKEHTKRIENIKKDARTKAKQMQTPSNNDLEHLQDMFYLLEELNTLTFVLADQIETIRNSKAADIVLLNQLQRRNEKANRKAWKIKKELRRKLNEYVMFKVAIPSDMYGNFKYETYHYDKVDKRIQKLIDEVESSLSEGEQLGKEYNKLTLKDY